MLFVPHECDKDCKMWGFKKKKKRNTPSPRLRWGEEEKRERNDQGRKVPHKKTSRQSDIQYREPYKLR